MKQKFKTGLAATLLFLLCGSFSFAQQQVQQWNRFEVVLKQIYNGNAFANVKLTAKFISKDTTYIADVTSSNIKQLNNQKGNFECVAASGNNHGIVRVSNTYNFKYADGKQYYPVGTTAYAWNHMSKPVQEMTLQSLKQSGFNKVRMCVFPKDYNLVKEEPEIYPFVSAGIEKGPNGKERKVWDFTTFNPAFFRVLEKQIDELNQLGIEADLILFHPYDKGRM